MKIAEEDYRYLAAIFPKGYRGLVDQFLDPREPEVKRNEFSKIRNHLFAYLEKADGLECQLKYECCDESTGFEVDHIFPLSTNVLNKRIRNLPAPEGKKVPAQAIGSNNPLNLILACKKCNGHKKHRLIKVEVLKRILESRIPV
jgi:5-methylcytosine-specific restriction endonuclease McrA